MVRLMIVLALVSVVAAQRGFFEIPGLRGQQRQRFQQRPRFQQNRFRGGFQQQQQTRFQQPNQVQQIRGGAQVNQVQNNRGPVDDNFGGHQYHYSWRHTRTPRTDQHGQTYTGEQARSYCSRLGSGWYAVSIDDAGENNFVKAVISGENQTYIWTGGSGGNKRFGWASGRGLGFSDWSHTGFNRRPQPDNREGNENCLAVLNNFYRDGIKWHDVACSHKKPVICERG